MTKQNNLEDEIIAYEEPQSLDELSEEDFHQDLDITPSPLYPKIYIGDSSKPLSGQFDESEYVDDNISRTWTGLLTSYFG